MSLKNGQRVKTTHVPESSPCSMDSENCRRLWVKVERSNALDSFPTAAIFLSVKNPEPEICILLSRGSREAALLGPPRGEMVNCTLAPGGKDSSEMKGFDNRSKIKASFMFGFKIQSEKYTHPAKHRHTNNYWHLEFALNLSFIFYLFWIKSI